MPMRSVRTRAISKDTQHCAPGKQADGVHSPDCEEPDPKSRQVRRMPKQHRAVAGFMVGVLGGLAPLKFTCPAV